MELKKKYIHMNGEEGRASSQVAMDDEFNVPDARPDVEYVIARKGQIKADETRVMADQVWIRGRLIFWVLYQPQGEQGLYSLKGEIPFQEKISMDGIREEEKVRFQWKLEDLTVQVIHSRKLGIRALLEITVLADRIEEAALTSEVIQQEKEEIQVAMNECETAQLVESHPQVIQFQQEIEIPSSRPNIREILWECIQTRGLEQNSRPGEIDITGELLLFVLYRSEGEDSRLEWFETSVPLKTSIACENVPEGSQEVELYEKEYGLEIKNDGDGEPRLFQVSSIMDAMVRNYEIRNESYVEDLYGVNCQVQPELETDIVQRILVKNHAKIKATEQIKIQEPVEVQQICCCQGRVEIDQKKIIEDGVEVSGTVEVGIYYLTDNHVESIRLQYGFLPFQQKLEAPGIGEDCRIRVEGSIEQLNTVLGAQNQVDIRAVLALELLVIAPVRIKMVKSVRMLEQDLEEIERIPGMVGYIAGAGERLWDIAKEHHTTIDQLKKLNQLKSDTLKGGEKLLIIKSL